MGLTRLSLVRPLAILMLIVGIVLMGAVSYTRLNVDRLPPISIPFVSVSVNYPGASPEDVETLILEPIEDSLNGVPGAQLVRSTAREGSGSVNVQLVEGTDLDKAFVEVQRRIASIAGRLPKDASDPRISKFDPNASPIINLAMTGQDQEQLYQVASDVVLPKLLSLPGVADADLSGGQVREVDVQLDLAKMSGYGVTVDQVTAAMQRENISAPVGNLEQGSRSVSIRSSGLFQNVDELGNLIIGTARPGTPGVSAVGTGAAATTPGTPIYLRNIATIKEGYREQTRYLRLDGQDAVGISIYKQSDANTIAVSDAVRAALEPLKVALPEGSDLVVVNDSARFVRRSVNAIQNDLALAAFLTATVLVLFLHTWRNMLIVLLAIPTCLVSTCLVMFALGFSLNLMTLMALAMTIGILVDDSIVVLENIHRHLSKGETPFQAALNGRSEIGMAAMAITFTDVVVYLPVAFMQGNVGQLFRQYGLTIATATLFSLFVSFTLTPMLASRWLKSGNHDEEGRGWWARFTRAWERGFDRVAARYGRGLGWALHHRPLVVIVGLVALSAGISVLPLKLIGSEYAPQEDDGQFSVNISMPVGTSLAIADDAARQMEALLRTIPEVRSVYASVGGGGNFGGGSARLTVEAGEKSERSRSMDDILADVRTLGRQIPDAQVRTQVQNPLSGGGAGITVELLGDDLATLSNLADQVIKIAEDTPGIADASSSFQQQSPEVRFAIDRERAAAAGVTATSISSALRTIVQGTTVSQLRKEGEPAMDIVVSAKDSDLVSPSTLASVPIAYNRSAGPVLLGQVTTQRRAQAPVQISRVDRKRTVSVNATVAGRAVGDVARDLQANLGALPLPPGYLWTVRGTVQQLQLAFTALTSALALSIVLVYMLLVALYESWLYPLAIMFALPVSLVGAFGGLLITGNTINIFSMIGIIALMGLVAKNGILLIDYTNTLRQRGLGRTEALTEAARTRLRPIVMTTSTVVAAMFPLLFKFEAGAESRAPMAAVIVGGVISSTLLTLVLVPTMYAYLDDLQHKLHIPATFRWPWQKASELQPAPLAVRESEAILRASSEAGGD